MYFRLIASLFLVAATILPACNSSYEIHPNGKQVSVGLIARGIPGDGADSHLASQAMMWFLSREPYLPDGTEMQLVVEHDHDSAAGLEAAMRKFAKQENIVAVVVFSESDLILQNLALFDELALPVLAAMATNPEVVRNNQYISQLSFDDEFQGAVAALYVREELEVKRVTLLNKPASAHSSYLAQEFVRRFELVGGEILADGPMATTPAELRRQLQQAREAETQLLFLTQGYEGVLAVLQHLHDMDWQPMVMVRDGILAYVTTNHPESVDIFEGVIATDVATPGMYLPRRGRRLIQGFDMFAGELNTYSVLAIEAADLLQQTLADCDNDMSRPCFQKHLRRTGVFMGVLGHIGFSESGTAQRPVVIHQIHRGKRVFVARVY